MTTQVSYGFMANLYNAFGLYGTFIGTLIFIPCLYYVLRLWFVGQELTFGPYGSSIWYILLGLLFEHSLVEAPIGSLFPSLLYLCAPVSLVLLARFLVSFFSDRRRPYAEAG
jgi:hypothetical protein